MENVLIYITLVLIVIVVILITRIVLRHKHQSFISDSLEIKDRITRTPRNDDYEKNEIWKAINEIKERQEPSYSNELLELVELWRHKFTNRQT